MNKRLGTGDRYLLFNRFARWLLRNLHQVTECFSYNGRVLFFGKSDGIRSVFGEERQVK